MGVHEPTLVAKTVKDDSQEVTDVPEDIANRAAALSAQGVGTVPSPTPGIAEAEPGTAEEGDVAMEEGESEEFAARDWSEDDAGNKAAAV